MSAQIIQFKKTPAERLKKDLQDPEFIEDLEGATSILVVVQHPGNERINEGMITNLMYTTDNMASLHYILSMAGHMVLSARHGEDLDG